MRISTVALVGLGLLALAGCEIRGRATVPTATVRVTAPPPPAVRASISVGAPQLATGVQVVQHQC